MRPTLLAARQRLYPLSRPAFVALGVGAAYASDAGYLEGDTAAVLFAKDKKQSTSVYQATDRIAALPLLAVGTVGISAVLSRRGGLTWLSHGYERIAWAGVFGSLAASAAAEAAGSHQGDDGISDQSGGGGSEKAVAPTPDLLLAPAAGFAIAACAGERLGSTAGRLLLPALGALGVMSAGAAMAFGAEQRMPPSLVASVPEAVLKGSRHVLTTLALTEESAADHGRRASAALQASALAVLPLLHLACPPVYTMSTEMLMGLAWVCAAAGFRRLEADALEENGAPVSPVAARNLLLAVGAASSLRTLVRRAPICQF